MRAVPDRVTVYDFYATWCKPCRELSARLDTLAAAHPRELSVRKVDVVDWDSEAARIHLMPRYDLPHVKVFDARGTLRFERSDRPEKLIEAIEGLLDERD